jgi:hypothetical protein
MRIPVADVNRVLEKTAADLKKVGGADGKTSRPELGRLLQLTDSPEGEVAERIWKLAAGANPGKPVTARAIDKGLAVVRAEISAFDTDHNGFSPDEVAKMPSMGEWAVGRAKSDGEERKEIEKSVREAFGSVGIDGARLVISDVESDKAKGTINGKPFEALMTFSTLLSVEGRRVSTGWDGSLIAHLKRDAGASIEVPVNAEAARRFLLEGVEPTVK